MQVRYSRNKTILFNGYEVTGRYHNPVKYFIYIIYIKYILYFI